MHNIALYFYLRFSNHRQEIEFENCSANSFFSFCTVNLNLYKNFKCCVSMNTT